jgi:hypothetical protein
MNYFCALQRRIYDILRHKKLYLDILLSKFQMIENFRMKIEDLRNSIHFKGTERSDILKSSIPARPGCYYVEPSQHHANYQP